MDPKRSFIGWFSKQFGSITAEELSSDKLPLSGGTMTGSIQLGHPGEGDTSKLLFDRADTKIFVGMGFHIRSGEGIALEAPDLTNPNSPVEHTVYLSSSGVLNLNGNALGFANGSLIQEGGAGIEQVCSATYRLRFEQGLVKLLDQVGSDRVLSVIKAARAPNTSDNVVGGFYTGCRWQTANGSDYELFNDTAANDADWRISGKADLVNGLVPLSQLPAYFDVFVEYANLAAFPIIGDTAKIYIAIDTGLSYRWSGATYSVLDPSLALGETSATAYRGDRGKSAYDHSQVVGNAHNLTGSDVRLLLGISALQGSNTGDQSSVPGNAGTASALQTVRTIDGVAFNGTSNITVVAPATTAAPSKATPVDADLLPLADSAADNTLKKLSWGSIKATLKSYFDSLYPSGAGTSTGLNTGDQTNISGNAVTVTTNANLTGHVTSVGNAAVLGSFTKSQLNTAILDGNGVYVGDPLNGTLGAATPAAATVTQLTLQSNISSAAWTTNGLRIRGVAATLTDTTSSGTVAVAYTDVFGGGTIAASTATTFSDYITAFFREATSGANVGFTRKWALGAESARFGTSNQVTIDAAGVLSMAATLNLTAGTAALPALIPVGDTNTGAWFPAADTFAISTGGSERLRVTPGGFVGIGQLSPLSELHVSGTSGAIHFDRFSTDSTGAGLIGKKARGTQASPTQALSGDVLTFLAGRGYQSGGAFGGSAGAIFIVAAENFTSTAQGTYVTIATTPIGSTTRAERVRITDTVATFSTNIEAANLSGTNTGDQALSDYALSSDVQSRFDSLKTINGEAIPGPGNIAIAVATTYVHTQIAASAVWSIAHGLGTYPSVTVIDSGESVVIGDVQYIDNNNLIITFSAAFGGKAYLN